MAKKTKGILHSLIETIWAADERVDKDFASEIIVDAEVSAIRKDAEYARTVVNALEFSDSADQDLDTVFVRFCQKAARVRESIPSLALLAKLRLLDINARSKCLCRLVSGASHRLFAVVDTFETSLRELEFETLRLKEFFENGIKRVGNDMAAGRFYRHVEFFVEEHALQAEERFCNHTCRFARRSQTISGHFALYF